MPVRTRLPKRNLSSLEKGLKNLDKDLMSALRREMRNAIRPTANELKGRIPSASDVPLSGMATRPGRDPSGHLRNVRQSPEQRAPFVYRAPSQRINVGYGPTRSRRPNKPVSIVSISFRDKRPFAAFSVMETAGIRSPGNPVDRSLRSAGYPLRGASKGKGRFVRPFFYEKKGDLVRMADRIIDKIARTQLTRSLARAVRNIT